jgi:hypothetical protein
MRQILMIAVALSVAMIAPGAVQAKSPKSYDKSLLKFNRARVLEVCRSACHSPGGNPKVCCICNGGNWIGGRCT